MASSSNENLTVAGIGLASAAGGISYADRDDIVLMSLAPGSQTAAVFTNNAFCAAPVQVARAHLAAVAPRFLLINSGNANAGTGEPGLRSCYETCRQVAAAAGCAMNEILPFSTGVIGEDLPTEPFARELPGMMNALLIDGWERASQAIMTTDTRPKLVSEQVEIDGETVTVTGMAKGAGMIRPDMATMLAFIATDARVTRPILNTVLQTAVADTFNSITVDGDTSTNDACVLTATGHAEVGIEDLGSDDGQAFQQAVKNVCDQLATAIIEDAEGATKLVRIRVSEARDRDEARQVGYTVAHSPLVKTALFASDPNWGRILAAVGRAGLPDLDIDQIQISLEDVIIVSRGGRDAAYTEAAGQAVFDQPHFTINISLGRGEVAASVLTCDLSYDYVKINAEYRS
ncbi:MAG: bifunctional glutamate N-acetyltransferase/amino-acid acetyltransferase ArgJ [bacterium]